MSVVLDTTHSIHSLSKQATETSQLSTSLSDSLADERCAVIYPDITEYHISQAPIQYNAMQSAPPMHTSSKNQLPHQDVTHTVSVGDFLDDSYYSSQVHLDKSSQLRYQRLPTNISGNKAFSQELFPDRHLIYNYLIVPTPTLKPLAPMYSSSSLHLPARSNPDGDAGAPAQPFSSAQFITQTPQSLSQHGKLSSPPIRIRPPPDPTAPSLDRPHSYSPSEPEGVDCQVLLRKDIMKIIQSEEAQKKKQLKARKHYAYYHNPSKSQDPRKPHTTGIATKAEEPPAKKRPVFLRGSIQWKRQQKQIKREEEAKKRREEEAIKQAKVDAEYERINREMDAKRMNFALPQSYYIQRKQSTKEKALINCRYTFASPQDNPDGRTRYHSPADDDDDPLSVWDHSAYASSVARTHHTQVAKEDVSYT